MPETEIILILLVVAFAAGWIDAVVGGGGLIQVPLLLLIVPAISPSEAVGTSKLAAIMGTAYAIHRFRSAGQLAVGFSVKVGMLTAVGGAGGAILLTIASPALFRPILAGALVAVVLLLVTRPAALYREEPHSVRQNPVAIAVVALALGLYDGFVGPGTGTFLVIALGILTGWPLRQSTANAKIVNAITYLGPLIVFALNGALLWRLGLMMGLMNVAGAHLGVGAALGRSTAFIRRVLLVTVIILAVRTGLDSVLA